MFRRKSEPAASAPVITPKPGGKGRPTPTRKEVEAANRARAKTPRGRKAQSAAQRTARAESSARMREALRTGDERYLPARDKGPVKRFVRDFIDTRFTFAELALPLVVICFGTSFVGSGQALRLANIILTVMIVVIAINLVFLRLRLGSELKRRFPDAPTRGVTWYLCSRALQLRFIRTPRAQRRVGEELPETYR